MTTNRSASSRRRKAADEEPALPAAFPPWVMLERHGTTEVHGCCASSIADNKTLAGGHTSTGHPISVSLCLAPPPEGSRLHVQLPADAQNSSVMVLAAHRDSVLVEISLMIRDEDGDDEFEGTDDYFVYNAGGNARPPSLLLLPACHVNDERDDLPDLELEGTGVLRRGEDYEFVVVELKTVHDDIGEGPELLLFLSGEWCVKGPAISNCDDAEKLASSWEEDLVVPIGDELLCWVDLSHGLLFSNVFDEDPGLRFVPIPVPVDYSKIVGTSYRNVCVTAGDAIKFVDISPRCCCGSEGVTNCPRSQHAYTVRTWTLRMEDMSWQMDGVLDAAQLWALDGYKGLPRVKLVYPVVSMDDPHVISFEVCEMLHQEYGQDEEDIADNEEDDDVIDEEDYVDNEEDDDVIDEEDYVDNEEDDDDIDKTAWRIMVDMRSKALRSVVCLPMNMRKDYVLMDIKASESCVLCSSCSDQLQL